MIHLRVDVEHRTYACCGGLEGTLTGDIKPLFPSLGQYRGGLLLRIKERLIARKSHVFSGASVGRSIDVHIRGGVRNSKALQLRRKLGLGCGRIAGHAVRLLIHERAQQVHVEGIARFVCGTIGAHGPVIAFQRQRVRVDADVVEEKTVRALVDAAPFGIAIPIGGFDIVAKQHADGGADLPHACTEVVGYERGLGEARGEDVIFREIDAVIGVEAAR